MPTTIPTRLRTAALGAVAATLLVAGVACSSSDDDATTTTTTAAAEGSTTTTSTTLPGNTPTVSDAYAPQVDDSGAGVNGKVYLSITGGAAADSLVGVKVAADVAGGAKLTPETEVAVPATETVNLDEDATYIELTDLAGPLELNRGFEITLEFETSPDVTVEVVVRDGGVAN